MANKRGNNEGTIYKRSDGTFRAQISLDGHRMSHSAKSHKECQDWNRKMRDQVDDGMTYKGAKTTLEEHLGEWLTMKSTTARSKTDRQYRQIARDYKYVIFSGMGGSGLSMQVVKTTFEDIWEIDY